MWLGSHSIETKKESSSTNDISTRPQHHEKLRAFECATTASAQCCAVATTHCGCAPPALVTASSGGGPASELARRSRVAPTLPLPLPLLLLPLPLLPAPVKVAAHLGCASRPQSVETGACAFANADAGEVDA